jgi:hypothetical protein
MNTKASGKLGLRSKVTLSIEELDVFLWFIEKFPIQIK